MKDIIALIWKQNFFDYELPDYFVQSYHIIFIAPLNVLWLPKQHILKHYSSKNRHVPALCGSCHIQGTVQSIFWMQSWPQRRVL